MGFNSVLCLTEDLLSLLEVFKGSLQVEAFLNLLDFIISLLEFNCNGLQALGITNPSVLGVIEELKPSLCLFLGVVPAIDNPLDVSFQELWLVWVLQKLLSLGDEVIDNGSLGLELGKSLLLTLNELINILDTAGSNFTGGAEHDGVQELNVWFELVTVGVALPVQVDLDLSGQDSGNEFLVLDNQALQLLVLVSPLLL